MPYLTRAQLREIDRLSIERYHIPGIVLMENAARGAAEVAIEMLGDPAGAAVFLLIGGGNNGGDGLAIARRLHNCGARVTLALATDPSRFTGDALINWRIAVAMNLPALPATPELMRQTDAKLMIDAIFGTGLAQAPRAPFGEIAKAVNERRVPVLAIDIPSGLDCDTGLPAGACIIAARTVTFAAQKAGFANPASRPFTGKITLVDIGCPRELIDELAAPPRP